MKVIFLGGGYLGYNLSKLLEDTYETALWGIDSPYTSLSDSFCKVNAFDEEAMGELDFKDAVIVDTISLVSNDAKSEDADAILENVRKKYETLIEILKKGQAKQFIFFSSGGTIYGSHKDKVSEEVSTNPETLYAKSKVMLEEILQNSGINYLILRLSNPYGGYQIAGKRQGVIPILIRSALLDEPFHLWASSDSVRDYFYIDDLAKAIDLLIQHNISREIINVGSGTGASLEKVIEIIEEETNSKIEITREDSNVPIVDSIVLDIHKLEKLTGYKPTVSLEEGIKYEIMRIKEEI